MTLMKQSLISNYILSLLSIKNGFSEVLLKTLPEYSKVIASIIPNVDYYIKEIDTYIESVNDNYIKLTADIFEAIIGAIYLDTNQCLGKTKDILRRLYGNYLKELTSEEYIKRSPKFKFDEFCKQHDLGKPVIT